MKSFSFARAWFVASFAVLAFLYGTAVGEWEWFPHSVLDQAVGQGRALYNSYTSDPASDLVIGKPAYEWSGARAVRSEKISPGLTSITSAWKDDKGTWKVGLRLIDSEGEVLHEWLVEREQLFEKADSRRSPTETSIHGSYLFPDGDVVVNLSQVGMARVDACGDVVWRLNEGNHHSIDRANDGSFWSPAYASKPRTKSQKYPEGFPGLNGKKLWGDRIMKVSESGQILKEIDFLDIVYSNGLERYIVMEFGGMYPGLGGGLFGWRRSPERC